MSSRCVARTPRPRLSLERLVRGPADEASAEQSRTGRPRYARRAFLAGLGAAVLHPRCLRAAGRKLSDISFAVVTDSHLGYKDEDRAEKLWRKAAAEIDAAPGAFVLHLGDIVDGGREAQYPIYLEGRKLIRKPVHEIPGNHDPADKVRRHIREQARPCAGTAR